MAHRVDLARSAHSNNNIAHIVRKRHGARATTYCGITVTDTVGTDYQTVMCSKCMKAKDSVDTMPSYAVRVSKHRRA